MVNHFEKPEINPHTTWKLWTQRRYILTFMVFLGYFNIYSLRVNLSIAILAMTENRYDLLANETFFEIGPEFYWDNKIQGYLLSSFFYGYITTQLLGGILAAKYGGKLIFGGGVASASLITLLSPWLAAVSVYALLVGRILMGVFEGVTYASLYCLWQKWIPPIERARITSQSNAGSYTGAVLSMIFYAYLQKVAGWRSIFWFSGGLGLLWYVIWVIIIAESPEQDPKISSTELQYILLALKDSTPTKNYLVPWKHMLSSRAVWALNVAIGCETWGFYTLLTLLPKYFKDVYQFDISESGILAALPYLSMAIMMQISGQLADRIVQKKWLTVVQTRKTCMAVGFLSQCFFMLGAAFCGDTGGTVFCLVMAVGLGSLAVTTIATNALDIGPLNSSLVFGIANTCGTVPGIISPIIAGYVISTDNPTVDQWRIVFYIAAGLYLFGAVTFTVLGSGERQQWDYESISKKEPSSNGSNNKT